MKTKPVNHRIYDTLMKIHNNNSKVVNSRYKFTMLKIELNTLNV